MNASGGFKVTIRTSSGGAGPVAREEEGDGVIAHATQQEVDVDAPQPHAQFVTRCDGFRV
jgi:hypothetical protein